MEFNLGAIAIGIVSFLALIFPFVLDYRSRKKKENNLLQPLKKTAEQQNFQINDYEICSNFVIGIDKMKNVFFFHSQDKDNSISKFIDLTTIENCKAVTLYNTTSNSKTVNKLKLSFIDKNKTEQTVDIYNADGISRLNGEIQLTNKWCQIVTNQLSK